VKSVAAYVGFGSNLGNGRAIIREAWRRMGAIPGITLDGLSNPYLSAPVGMTSEHWFTNAVGRLQVSLAPLDLLAVMLLVESQMGRTRDVKTPGYQDRSLDLDLLYYGDTVLSSPELILPHPRIADRFFVLVPLAEIAPQLRDGATGCLVTEAVKLLEQRISAGEENHQEIVTGSWDE